MALPEQLALPFEPPDIKDIFLRVFTRLGIERPVVNVAARFYPFTGLRSTVVVRQGAVTARVSDLLAGAPRLVLEALAEILLARVFRRRPSPEARACYLAYTHRPAVRARIDAARRKRSSKRLLPPIGRCHNLEEIFDGLNQRFFSGKIPAVALGWSHGNARRTLGHYDSAHAALVVSRRLDSSSVPRCVVEYVVYHEMLHIRFPLSLDGHRRVVHSREFRREERKFPQYELACRHIRLMAGSLR